LSESAYVIRALERAGDLNRALEYLPSEEEIAERRKAGEGLTRPELAIILSYGKIWLYRALIHSDVPEDPFLSAELNRYFPSPVQKRFEKRIKKHRLRREIIATAITNSLINRMGPVFPVRAQDDTGADPAAIARAYSIAREVFSVRDIWAQIEALDNKIPAAVQYTAMFQTTRLLRHMSYWLLENRRDDLDIKRAVSRYGAKVSELSRELHSVLSITEQGRLQVLKATLVEQHVPEHLAGRIAALEPMHCALDLVDVAMAARVAMGYAARAYFDLGERIGLTWIKEQIEGLAADGHWQAVARGTLRDNLYTLQRRITLAVLGSTGGEVDRAQLGPGGSLEARDAGSAHRHAARLCHPVGGVTGRPTPGTGVAFEGGRSTGTHRPGNQVGQAHRHCGRIGRRYDRGVACAAGAERQSQGHGFRRQSVLGGGVERLGLVDALPGDAEYFGGCSDSGVEYAIPGSGAWRIAGKNAHTGGGGRE
jgi:glutamate dehydrogenase